MEKTSANTYPFVKCFNPQVIINKYNHEKMMVSCGKCEACLNRKSSMNTLKCRLESKQHLYAKFITLTYDDIHIPRMAACLYDHVKSGISSFHDLYKPYHYCELTPRLNGLHCETLSPFEDKNSHYMMSNKVDNKYIPYLCKRDLQLFFKRLRRYYERLSKKYHIPFGEFRYYACGEYGPIHFRPHYHIILWYSCDEIHKTIGEAVSACWKFGRLTTETPRDDVSKYVAKYVNGNCNLPEILKSPKIRPFSVHSQHLGESVFEKRKQEVYESSTEDVIRTCCHVNGDYSDVYMWRTLKAYYFPRCKAYDICSPQFRLYSYLIKERADQIFGKNNLAVQARSILSYLWSMTKYKIQLHGQWHDDVLINDFYKYFIDMCDIDPYLLECADIYERSFRSVYMVLRLSNHFIKFCCDGNTSRANYMIKKIDNFYKDCDYLNLKGQYVDLEQFASDWFEDEEEYSLCFSLYPDAIRNTRVYRHFWADTKNRFSDSMKHKRQNDANYIFTKLK